MHVFSMPFSRIRVFALLLNLGCLAGHSAPAVSEVGDCAQALSRKNPALAPARLVEQLRNLEQDSSANTEAADAELMRILLEPNEVLLPVMDELMSLGGHYLENQREGPALLIMEKLLELDAALVQQDGAQRDHPGRRERRNAVLRLAIHLHSNALALRQEQKTAEKVRIYSALWRIEFGSQDRSFSAMLKKRNCQLLRGGPSNDPPKTPGPQQPGKPDSNDNTVWSIHRLARGFND